MVREALEGSKGTEEQVTLATFLFPSRRETPGSIVWEDLVGQESRPLGVVLFMVL